MFKKGFILFWMLVVSCGTAFAQYDLDHFYYSGRQALIDGKYSQAIERFNVLAQLDSTVYEAYFFRGIAKYNLGDLAGALNMTVSAISHQLKILKQWKLVRSKRSGKQVYYSLADEHVRVIMESGLEHISE